MPPKGAGGKKPGKRFALWPVWSRATTDGCVILRRGAYHAPTVRDRERSNGIGSDTRCTCAALSPWAHNVRPYGAGRFPFVRAHTMRPQSGTGNDQKQRSSSLTLGAQCAPGRSGVSGRSWAPEEAGYPDEAGPRTKRGPGRSGRTPHLVAGYVEHHYFPQNSGFPEIFVDIPPENRL